MDPAQFDALSRKVAAGVSRRQAVARFGAAGLLAGLTTALGHARAAGAVSAVQGDALSVCLLDIVATIRLGPNAGVILQGNVPGELRGQVGFTVSADGTVENGQFLLAGGAQFPVVGQADGRALNLRVDIAPEQTLILVGTAAQRLDQCTGDVDGLFTGPSVGDLGDWHATGTLVGGGEGPPPTATGGAAPAAPAAPVATAPTGGPAATAPPASAPTATAPATATTTATPAATPTPAPTDTPPTPTLQPPTPTPEGCPPGTTNCATVCVDLLIDPAHCGACLRVCPPSQICLGGQCGCPAGSVDCAGTCLAECPAGEQRVPPSCACCKSPGTACTGPAGPDPTCCTGMCDVAFLDQLRCA